MGTLTEDQAQTHLEQLRWPEGAQCPFCRLHQVTKLNGKRQGFYQCNRCRKQFTVRTGTIFERSHVPLSRWLQAVNLLCASKKGMSALQVSRMLGVTYKTAWFMCHRIRYAMRRGGLTQLLGTVEVDEAYIGGKADPTAKGRSTKKKTPVVAIVQRDGDVRTRVVRSVSAKDLKQAIRDHVHIESIVMTDDFKVYRNLDEEFADHQAVKHSRNEYARGEAHVNTCESFFALLKRGVMGSFHHVSRKHLQRYCDEFAYRWDYRKVSDAERAESVLRLAEGKRLMYRSLINGAAKAQAN